MLETLLNITGGSVIGVAGTLAAINTIIVEVLKNVLPKKFPTKALAMITSFFVMAGCIIAFGSFNAQSIVLGIFGSFVIAFISMFGFDTFKEVLDRFKVEKDKGGEE